MSFPGRSALGVDVTDGTLKAVLLRRRGRRVTVKRCWRVPYAHEPDADAGALGALSAFFRTVGPHSLARIVVSAPGRSHFSRTYLIPSMEAARLGEMVRYEVLNELQVPADDVLVRWHVRKGVVENQVHALAYPRRRIDAFRAALAERRVPYDDLQPAGFALASFIEHEMPLGRDRILLGVGELTTELVLLREDGIWTRSLPLGLAHEETERALAERLATEIAAATAYLLPADTEFRPVDVVLTEEGAASAGLTGALHSVLQLPVTRLDELRRLVMPERLRIDGQTPEEVLSMGKAYGLALAGVGLGRFQCPVHAGNPRRDAVRRRPLAAASLVVAGLGLLGVTHLAERRVGELDALLAGDLPAEMRTTARRAQQLARDAADRRVVAEALWSLAARRPAAHAVRRVLAVATDVTTDGPEDTLHVDSVWLAPTDPGRPGLITLTWHAAPVDAADLGRRLADAYQVPFPGAVVQGPEEAPIPGLQRWTIEVPLP